MEIRRMETLLQMIKGRMGIMGGGELGKGGRGVLAVINIEL